MLFPNFNVNATLKEKKHYVAYLSHYAYVIDKQF